MVHEKNWFTFVMQIGNSMRKEVGKYFIDISKLVFGGVVLSTILKIEDFSKIKIFISGMAATIVIATIGFIIFSKDKN